MIFKSSRALNQNVSNGQTKFIDYRLFFFPKNYLAKIMFGHKIRKFENRNLILIEYFIFQ